MGSVMPSRFSKRVLDVTLALAALILLSPVLIVVAMAVWVMLGLSGAVSSDAARGRSSTFHHVQVSNDARCPR